MKRLARTLVLAGVAGGWALVGVHMYGWRSLRPAAGGGRTHEVVGALHVHTRASDGSGTVSEVAEAARRAGLDFIVVTDHNRTQVEAEGWYHGVLVIMGAEITTAYGHYVYCGPADSLRLFNYGCPTAPLERAGADEWTVLAHPVGGPNPFRRWDLPGYDAIEIYNADTAWRTEPAWKLVAGLCWYPFFRAPLNLIVHRPSPTLAWWDALDGERLVTGIGSVDAHARIRIGRRHFIPFPSYEKSFRVVRVHVPLETPWSEDRSAARAAVLQGLARGRAFIEMGDFADPAGFTFALERGRHTFLPGDRVEPSIRQRLLVRAPRTAMAVIRLLRNGTVIREVQGDVLLHPHPQPGRYRVEVAVRRRAAPLFGWREAPWIFSNPIVVAESRRPGNGRTVPRRSWASFN